MNPLLDIKKIIFGAFVLPWWYRKAFFRALLIPIALLGTLILSWHYFGSTLPIHMQWIIFFIHLALFCGFAVICHRLILVDPIEIAHSQLKWSLRETRFTIWTLILGCIFMLAGALTFSLLNVVRVPIESWNPWVFKLFLIPPLYIVSRLSVVFPAIALDKKVSLKWAWKLTRGNGWKMFIIVGVLPWVISQITNLLYRESATAVETIILTLIGISFIAIEVAALSLAYKELSIPQVE